MGGLGDNVPFFKEFKDSFFLLDTHAHVFFLVTISLWQADGKEGEPNAGRRASEERTEVST